EVLSCFDPAGAARVYDWRDDAMLLERLSPGTTLAQLVNTGHDDEATDILADVITRLTPRCTPARLPAVEDRSASFSPYLAIGDAQIPAALVARAHQWYLRLAASQTAPRLLHGDLHHENVLHDATRGWLAVDAKGIIGEVEYEVGA